VFGVLFNAKKFFNNKLGVTVDVAATNDHADMGSMHRALTKPEVDFYQHHVETIYSTFVSHVADGRSMRWSEVDNIGQGRVWSGVDAKRIKLIDEFGGLNAAVEKAVLLASLEKYRVIERPKQKETFEIIMESLGQAKVKLMKRSSVNILEDYEPIANLLRMNGKAQARLPYDVELK
jgi:protease-4